MSDKRCPDERIISTMVSTLQVKNGFRTELLPMALATAGPSASALCNSIMAVSAFHQGGAQAALPFKTRAIRQLYDSLHANGAAQDPEISEVQMAASMMLCVYSVRSNGGSRGDQREVRLNPRAWG